MADDEKHPYVAIVSEAMAKKYWPNQDAIGRKFAMGSDPGHPMEVVGVAKDARYQGFVGTDCAVFLCAVRAALCGKFAGGAGSEGRLGIRRG